MAQVVTKSGPRCQDDIVDQLLCCLLTKTLKVTAIF